MGLGDFFRNLFKPSVESQVRDFEEKIRECNDKALEIEKEVNGFKFEISSLEEKKKDLVAEFQKCSSDVEKQTIDSSFQNTTNKLEQINTQIASKIALMNQLYTQVAVYNLQISALYNDPDKTMDNILAAEEAKRIIAENEEYMKKLGQITGRDKHKGIAEYIAENNKNNDVIITPADAAQTTSLSAIEQEIAKMNAEISNEQ